MVRKRDVEFEAERSVRLRDWLFTPEVREPRPAITMAHGYAGAKELGLERFAKAFAEAGFVVLADDHRNFGASDGENRVTLIPGSRSPIGGVRFRFSRACRRSIPSASGSGERAMREDTPSFWARPTGGSAASSPNRRPSAAMSRGCGAFRPRAWPLPYHDQFPFAEAAATERFSEHLLNAGANCS
jgi:hypothetical protein